MTSTTPESADKPPLPDVLPFDDFAMDCYLDEIQRHVGRALNAARLMDKAIAMRRSLGFNVPPSPSSNAEGQRGSSDIRWGSWGESAGGEEHAEPVVVAVAEAAGEAAVEFDDPVHRLGAAVR